MDAKDKISEALETTYKAEVSDIKKKSRKFNSVQTKQMLISISLEKSEGTH